MFDRRSFIIIETRKVLWEKVIRKNCLGKRYAKNIGWETSRYLCDDLTTTFARIKYSVFIYRNQTNQCTAKCWRNIVHFDSDVVFYLIFVIEVTLKTQYT